MVPNPCMPLVTVKKQPIRCLIIVLRNLQGQENKIVINGFYFLSVFKKKMCYKKTAKKQRAEILALASLCIIMLACLIHVQKKLCVFE